MTPRQARAQIRAAIRRRPELRYKGTENREAVLDMIAKREQWQNDFTCPYRGFCYIATQAFCRLITSAVPYCNDNGTHYWARIGDELWDLTAEQFGERELERIYATERPTKFKTLCFRAEELLEEAQRGAVAA